MHPRSLQLVPAKPTRKRPKAAEAPASAAPSPKPADQISIIHEWQKLKAKAAEAEARILQEVGVDKARLEILEEQINSWYQELAPELPAVLETDLGFLQVTQREFKREFSAQAKRRFFASLSNLVEPLDAFELTQEKVKAHKGQKFLDEIITKDRTGVRRLKWAPKDSGPVAA